MSRFPTVLLACTVLSPLLTEVVSAQKKDQEKPLLPADYRAHLILAIEQRDLGRAREVIVEGGADVINMGDPSPLGEAVRLDDLKMTALLLRSGGDPTLTKDSPIQEALVNDSIDMVRLLFQAGAVVPESAMAEMLTLTLRGANAIAIYRELLNHGADVDLALRSAVSQRKLEATLLCLKRGGDVTGLGELSILDVNDLTSESLSEIVSLALQGDSRDGALSYFLSTAASANHRRLADLALGEGGQVALEHLDRAEKQGHDEMVLYLLEEMNESLSSLIRRSDDEGRAELAAYLTGLRNERIGSVVGPVAAGVGGLFVLLALLFFLRKNVLHSPRRLFEAVTKGQGKKVEKLLAAGADPNTYHRGEPLLNAATRQDDLKMARLLLRHEADVNRVSDRSPSGGGVAPLHIAAKNGSHALAGLFLRHGARVDVRTPDDQTPLFLAARGGHEDLLHLLISRGADLQVQIKEQPLLVLAAMERDAIAVRLLLEAGADPDANLGKSALHVAATTGDVEMVRLLLEHGAAAGAIDREGRTAHDLALFHKHADVAQELQGTAPGQAVPRNPPQDPRPPLQGVAFEAASAGAPVFETLTIPPPDVLPPDVPPPAMPGAAEAPGASPPRATPAYSSQGQDPLAIPLPLPLQDPNRQD